MTGRKITGLPLPETPREAPPEIHGLVNAIEDTLADSDAMQAAQVLGRAFEYLTRYFSGAAGAIAQHLGLPGDPSVALDFEEARVQLHQRLESLGDQATDSLSKLVRGVFYVGATRKSPTPRRHARLLDLGGIPIRGYRNLGEWIAIEPGTGDLSNDAKANRELLRYLPILKEWLTATATYFLDARQTSLSWEGEHQLSYTFEAEGVSLKVGPILLPPGLSSALRGVPTVPRVVPVTTQEVEQPAEAESVVAAPVSPPEPVAEAVAPQAPPEPPPVEPLTQPEPDPAIEAVAPQAQEPHPAEPLRQPEPAPATEAVVPMAQPEDVSSQVGPESAKAESEPEPAVPDDETDAPLYAIPSFEPITPPGEPLAPTALDSAPPPAEMPDLSLDALPTFEDIVIADPFPSFEPLEPAMASEKPEGDVPSEASPLSATPSLSPEVINPFQSPLMEPVANPFEAPDADSNPFATPGSPLISSTVALRREDFQLDFGALATPSIEPIAPPRPSEPELEEEDEEEVPSLDEAVGEAPTSPEPIGESAGAPPQEPVEEETPSPVPAGTVVAEETRGARVPPQLGVEKKSAAQISVPAAPSLYPVVTGPPPEFFDEVPVDADYPEILQVALTDLNGAIEANDSLLICGQMQRCFDIMIQFFAGVGAAILREIDSEELSEFDLEDGRFDLDAKLELLVASLASMEEHWEGNDAGTLLWSVFYDTLLPATDPNSAYLHSRLLGVEGALPEGFLEFSELCAVVPGKGALAERSACRETAHRYLPILAFWLENATPLFLESEVDFVEEDDNNALSWAASVAGATLDGTSSGFWLEVSPSRWNLPRPELAPVFVVGDAPEVLLPLIDELNANLEKKEYARAGTLVRAGLDFLIQYFAGCAAALWRDQGEMSEQAEEMYHPESSLVDRERLLLLSLGAISADSSVGAGLSKVFSKGSLQYKALAHRDVPAGMSDVAEWAGSREEVSESELLIYLPLLRSWLGASNPWFGAGEQLFEEPGPDGRLEGVVAFGEDFLEMVDPEFVIRLAPELVELLAPASDAVTSQEGAQAFTGQLPALAPLTVGPPLLIGHVGRLLEAGEDRRAANAWLGSAFEYLIQYFAGLCTTVLGGKDAPLSKANIAYFSPKASLRERELLLAEAINALKSEASGSTPEKIRAIFIDEQGAYRRHARLLGAGGPGSLTEEEMLLSFWCRIRHKTGTLTTEEYHFAVETLSGWLEAAKPFFGVCEHYAEDPGPDGQEEMVVELAEDYLDMVLPDYAIQIPARGYYELLYRETEAVAADEAAVFFPPNVRPELLGAKSTQLEGVADESGEILMGAAGVELGGDDFFGGADAYDSSDLFSGPAPVKKEEKAVPMADSPYARKKRTGTVNLGSTPEEPKPATPDLTASTASQLAEILAEVDSDGRRRKKKRTKKSELGTAVLELYKKERLEKARKRAEARARKEEAEPTRLAYKLSYRGLKTSKQLGGRCHFGLIELHNSGGGELKGTVEPSHPSVKVTPSRFEGNEVRVTYQIDPSDMPSTGRVGISLNTQDERIELRMEQLVPSSWARERTYSQALLLMTVPAVAYGVYLLYLIAAILGPDIEKSFNSVRGKDSLPFSDSLWLWLFSIAAILPGATGVPAAVKMAFARWDFNIQEETRKLLPLLMLLPTAIMAFVMFVTPFWSFHTDLTRLPVLASKVWMTVLTLGMNLLAAGLFTHQTTVWWEDNSDSPAARRAFRLFWVVTVALGVVATFFMSVYGGS